MIAESCPYLQTEASQSNVPAPPGPSYRCSVRHPPEPVGVLYQGTICLSPEFHRCQRLPGGAQIAELEPPVEEVVEPVVEPPPEIERKEPSPGTGSRRPLSVIELAVWALGISIVFATLFSVYAIVHRLRVGPGMAADPAIAGLPMPSSDVLGPTLVPTFTPTPLHTETAAPQNVATLGVPTPIPEPVLPIPTPVLRLPADSPPTQLLIPSISIDIPVSAVGTKTISEGGRSKVVWADMPNAGGFHQDSAYPGNLGNTVINGHRDILGAVFRDLNKVEVGDEIVVYVGEMAYPYNVTETIVVPETFASAKQRAENLRYIGHTPDERLTLVTCTPIGLATHRLLVIAVPPEQAVPQMPQAGSDTQP